MAKLSYYLPLKSPQLCTPTASKFAPPKPLTMDDNLATSWKQWRKIWLRYEIAKGINKQDGIVRVATLLSVIGEDAAKVYHTFTWLAGENEQCIDQGLSTFDSYCEPRTQIIYERFRFNNRIQEAGETISAYVTELRTICKASEQTSAQLQAMQSGTNDVVSFVRKRQTRHAASTPTNRTYKKSSTPKRATTVEQQDCKYCGRQHGKRECPAYGQTCRKCGKKNHFQAKCRAAQLSNVHMNEEVFFVGLIGDRSSNAVITVDVGRPRPQSRVQFQMDTGAECSVLSQKTYCRVTGDSQMKRVQCCSHKFIKTYTGERYQILGSVTLPVWRQGKQSNFAFNITEDDFTPLISLKTCTALGCVTINDSDSSVNDVSKALVLTPTPAESDYSERSRPALRLSLRKAERAAVKAQSDLLTDVFEGLGDLPGEYHIVTDEAVKPVIHPPRRVPLSLGDQIKAKLDEMVQRDIITPVTEPTPWVSSMLVVVKPDKLRICIDPRDLNRAICREHYQMPTIEEVATRLTNAKKFTVFDAKDGFWQKRLDKESIYKTTWNLKLNRRKLKRC